MTGYGKAEAQITGGKITVEIRSLNGKSADINIKSSLLPKDKDLMVRKKLAEVLVRGTIDLYLNYEPNAAEAGKPLNAEAIRAYFQQVADIRNSLPAFGPEEGGHNTELLAAILHLPEVSDTRKAEVITEENWPVVEKALDDALGQVCTYRSHEGAALYADVSSRVKGILELYNQVEAFEGERIDTVREKLTKALQELGAKVDPSRFEQELVFYLEKYDINEEKVRLRQHCKYFMDVIDSEPHPGKKLGFIIQEMGREINTTGSKANHALIQQLVVRMKDELEKIREQSLNIL